MLFIAIIALSQISEIEILLSTSLYTPYFTSKLEIGAFSEIYLTAFSKYFSKSFLGIDVNITN